MINKLKGWILPKEIDFFKLLSQQSLLTSNVIDALAIFYKNKSSQKPQHIFDLIAETKKKNSSHLKDLNGTFITPVDKEAISRAFAHLYWVNLSVKHLLIEAGTFEIDNLSEYNSIFDLLSNEVAHLTKGFDHLSSKKFTAASKNVDKIIHLDNKFIKIYAKLLIALFEENDFQHVFKHHEILLQLKEISKRIHICANLMEDIIFKMN